MSTYLYKKEQKNYSNSGEETLPFIHMEKI